MNGNQLTAYEKIACFKIDSNIPDYFQVDDLEQWIADREVIARSQDCGQDLEQCEV